MTEIKRAAIEGAEGRTIGTTETGENYSFHLNDSTGLGELHVGSYRIPMSEAQARLFADADAAARQTLLKGHYAAAEARANSKRQGAQR